MRDSGPGIALYIFMAASLLLAMLVAVFPLPEGYALLRPELVCLLVLYWVMHTPEHMGVSLGFLSGLLQDVVEGSVWGAHALALAVLAYIGVVSYRRIRNYSAWHQTLWVFVLVGTHQVLVNWVQGLAGYQASVADMLVPAVISALFWPPLCYGIDRLRRYYQIFS